MTYPGPPEQQPGQPSGGPYGSGPYPPPGGWGVPPEGPGPYPAPHPGFGMPHGQPPGQPPGHLPGQMPGQMPGRPPGGPLDGSSGPNRSAPGWLWPALVAAALVTGLLGGMLGGALVLGTGSSSSGGGVLTQVEGAAPLAADNDSVAAVAAKVLPSTVQVRVINGSGESKSGATGSGFVVDDKGHVITNNHVVEVLQDNGSIDVIDNAGRRHEAKVVGRSPVYDIAVLEVTAAEKLQPAALGSTRSMHVGETVVAIGSPLGLSSTVTSGIVSALDRPVTTGPADASSYIDAVQTDAAINPGNSGGPLVNLRGQVVGVNSAIATTGGSALGGEAGNIGVGFAIPMDQIRITAKQILDTGKAEYPVIGANVETRESIDGAKIVDVPSGTPAERAGLQQGDRVVAVEEKRIADGISLIVAIRTHRPGETISLTVVRDGKERTVRVRLEAKVG